MMLQDIYPHSLHNQYTEKSDPLPESPVFVFRKADLLVVESKEDAVLEDIDQSGEHGKISMPEAGTAGSEEKDFYRMRGRYLKLPTVKQLGGDREYIFLFSMDGGAFFLLSGDIADEGVGRHELRISHVGAHLLAYKAERGVGDVLHRGLYHRAVS